MHPNATYEKILFDPWHQSTWDVNDTVLLDPRTDPDTSGYVAGYFAGLPDSPPAPPWQTWYAKRQAGTLGGQEQAAAAKAAAHAETPTTAFTDSLGRPFLTLADNGPDTAQPGDHLRFATRVELDIEGNQRSVRDAVTESRDQHGNVTIDELGRIVMQYDYDMLGNRIYQASMEAGERWMLNDVTGNPIRAWDSRRFLRRMTYDELRRPTGLYVRENGVERLAERTVYGESLGDAANHRARVYQVFDGAGVLTNLEYDFKGNLQCNQRQLAELVDPHDTRIPAYRTVVDWSSDENVELGTDTYTTRTRYDALNRPLTATSPDGSVYRPTFNEANLLDKVEVNLRGRKNHDDKPVWTPFVTNIDYNAKGQRELIAYENGATTTYEYDPLTFRLMHMRTTRPEGLNGLAAQIFVDPTVVQHLHYTYDPVGNIVRIEDAALRTVTYGGQPVHPVCDYEYDALYRLIIAKGREHIGQNVFFSPLTGDYRDYPFVGHAHPNDLQALRNYTQHYEYDAVGNFKALRHLVSGGGWTRHFDYEEDSLIEAGKQSNQLTRTTIGNGVNYTEPYTHDAHGNMTAMPHLATMVWNFEDQLQRVDLGGGGTAYYVYDATGQRVRKVIESKNSTSQKERIYLGGFEVYREYNGNAKPTLERESLNVMDDRQRIALADTQTIESSKDVVEPVPLHRYQLGNHLGSASVELAEDGALISYEENHPYGSAALQARRNCSEISLKRYRYTGKERDEETGFCYHGVRYYAPWLGRWISGDPGGLADGLNLYCYVRDRPTVLNDGTGFAATHEKDIALTPSEYVSIQETKLRESETKRAETRTELKRIDRATKEIENLLILNAVDQQIAQAEGQYLRSIKREGEEDLTLYGFAAIVGILNPIAGGVVALGVGILDATNDDPKQAAKTVMIGAGKAELELIKARIEEYEGIKGQGRAARLSKTGKAAGIIAVSLSGGTAVKGGMYAFGIDTDDIETFRVLGKQRGELTVLLEAVLPRQEHKVAKELHRINESIDALERSISDALLYPTGTEIVIEKGHPDWTRAARIRKQRTRGKTRTSRQR